MMLLECEGLDTYYGDSQVLHDTSLSIGPSEHVGVIGRNGMGKSTLVHTIMGMVRPRKGKVVYQGKDYAGAAPEKIAAAGITLVPQGRRVFRSLSVAENLRVSYVDRGAGGWTVDEVCDRLPILRDRWSQLAGQLSGGQQQMLALGRALVGNGDLVLMDEPSEGLDQHHLALVVDVVQELRRRGTAVLVVEQKLKFALDMVDELHVMVRGQFVQTISTEEARQNPNVLMEGLGFGSAAVF
jgi:branched-chain amino acid transport system ATP-binding protein